MSGKGFDSSFTAAGRNAASAGLCVHNEVAGKGSGSWRQRCGKRAMN